MSANDRPMHVVVTGAADGIGKVIAGHFLQQGAKVTGIDNAPANQKINADKNYKNFTCIQCDVSDESQVKAAFETISKSNSRLNVLINCVGIAGPTAALQDIALNDWQKTFSLNVESTFLCCKHAIPLLKNSRATEQTACIINFSSTAGNMGYPNRSPYCAAKWAITGLTKTLAMELGADKIRVNAIAPGSVEGDRINRVIENESKVRGVSTDSVRQRYVEFTTLKSFIQPAEIAETILFLTSDAARNITGQVINVDADCQTLM